MANYGIDATGEPIRQASQAVNAVQQPGVAPPALTASTAAGWDPNGIKTAWQNFSSNPNLDQEAFGGSYGGPAIDYQGNQNSGYTNSYFTNVWAPQNGFNILGKPQQNYFKALGLDPNDPSKLWGPGTMQTLSGAGPGGADERVWVSDNPVAAQTALVYQNAGQKDAAGNTIGQFSNADMANNPLAKAMSDGLIYAHNNQGSDFSNFLKTFQGAMFDSPWGAVAGAGIGMASGLLGGAGGALAASGGGADAAAGAAGNVIGDLSGSGAGEFVTPQMVQQAVADGTLTAAQGQAALQSIGSAASSGAAGLTLNDIKQGYQIVNGVKTLVGAGVASGGTTGSVQSGATPSFTSPISQVVDPGYMGGGINLANVINPATVAGGLSLFDQLNSGISPPDTAAANAALQTQIANTAQDQANNNFNFYRTNYRPVEEQLTSDALAAGSPAMQEMKAGQAGATATTAFENAAAAEARRQSGLGINPNSGNSLALQNQNEVAKAANVDAAENVARQNERVYGDQLRSNVTGLGRGLQTNATALSNAATNAAAGSTNSAATTQQLANNQNANIGTAVGALTPTITSLINGSTTTPTPQYNAATTGYDPLNNTSTYDPSYGAVGNSTAGTAENPIQMPQDQINELTNIPFKRGGRVPSLTKPPSRFGYLKGGMARGPGTGTSDSIPVAIDGKRPGAIANGEYVLNAAATKKIGLKRLDRMNLKGLPAGSKMKDGVHVEKHEDGGVIHYGGTTQNEREMQALDAAQGYTPTQGQVAPVQPVSKNVVFSRAAPTAAQNGQLQELLKRQAAEAARIKATKFAVGGRVTAMNHFSAPRRAA